MFSSLAAREAYVAETKINIFASGQKHFCFPGTNFASETCVSQFSHHGSNVDQCQILAQTSSGFFFYAHA